MLNIRKKAVLICLSLMLAVTVFMTGCQSSGNNAQDVTESESETETETESETETETEFETDVVYISEDGSIRIVLPDSTWKVTQDLDEMRVFAADSGSMINIVHASDESSMKNISVMESEEELEETLTKQYPEEDAFEILLFEERSSSTVQTYEYVVKYNYSTSMWAYSITYGILSAEGDAAYVVSGTVTEDDEEMLTDVQEAVESFTVLDDSSIFSVLPGAVENNSTAEAETEEETDEEEAGSAELATLTEYSSSVTLYASASVNIRQYPSTEADCIGSLTKGSSVSATGETSSWFRVSVSGGVGYVSKAYLVSTAPETEQTESSTESTESTESAVVEAELNTEITYGTTYTYYATSGVNLRSQPSTGSSVVSTVASGTAVTVIGETDNWYLVTVNGVTGYISKGYLSSTQTTATESTESTESSAGSSAASTTGVISGTISAVTSDTVLITGDDGVTYSIYYANASVNSSGLTTGLYITATIDYSQTTTSGSLYATAVTGY